jgi:hypothetical protein
MESGLPLAPGLGPLEPMPPLCQPDCQLLLMFLPRSSLRPSTCLPCTWPTRESFLSTPLAKPLVGNPVGIHPSPFQNGFTEVYLTHSKPHEFWVSEFRVYNLISADTHTQKTTTANPMSLHIKPKGPLTAHSVPLSYPQRTTSLPAYRSLHLL